jgi:hypothetical protein
MYLNAPQQSLTCFKYRSDESAFECMEKGTLFFAAPHQLNDALEAKFDHAGAEAFYRVKEKTYNEICLKRREQPFTYNWNTHADMEIEYADRNNTFQAFCQQIGIFSAARRADHQAMWAYYANNGQGVCFELALTHRIMNQYQLWVTDVAYNSEARIHNQADDWRIAFLQLAAEHPTLGCEALIALSQEEPFRLKCGIYTASRAVSNKHTDWAHEQELRVLAPRSGPLPILSAVLKRVHFFGTKGKKWPQICEQLRTRYSAVELMHWQFSHGALSSVGTDMEFRLSMI